MVEFSSRVRFEGGPERGWQGQAVSEVLAGSGGTGRGDSSSEALIPKPTAERSSPSPLLKG